MTNFDESDQAGIIGSLFSLHLESKGHINNQPNPDCPFCKGFIIDNRSLEERQSLTSYSFLIIDVSNQ